MSLESLGSPGSLESQKRPTPQTPKTPETPRTSLSELALIFLRLGITSFGGPAAHIAMMEREFVNGRKWLTHEEFLDLLGATNLIPGPNSTEMAIHIGHRRCSWRGLFVAGICFILPAALIVGCIAAMYVRYNQLPQVAGILYGVKPPIIAIVVHAVWTLGHKSMRSPLLIFIGVACTAMSFFGVNELLVLLAAGLFAMIAKAAAKPKSIAAGFGFFTANRAAAAAATAAAVSPLAPNVGILFLKFLKIGSVLYGSGYVLVAFLRSDFVEDLRWLTERQLLDAVAVGQFTPGPVFTTATFIGYIISGPLGAMLATIGIFLPAFVFVAISGPLIPRIRKSPTAGAVLDGINVASVALMLNAAWLLGRSAIVDAPTIALALISLGLLMFTKLNSTWLVLAGVLFGIARD